MKIGGLQKTTLIDYPGKVACTVFLIGCNFRCPWCYSPELVLPEKIKNQPRISEKEFFEFLESRQGLLDGCVLCGGEPTIHKNLPDFIKKIKKLGYSVKLDTNGSNPALLKKLIDKKLIDYVAMDIKCPLEDYPRVSFYKKLENIKRSIDFIMNSGIDYEFRTTVLPALHNAESFEKMGAMINNSSKYFIQNFRPENTLDPKYRDERSFTTGELKRFRSIMEKYVHVVRIRENV